MNSTGQSKSGQPKQQRTICWLCTQNVRVDSSGRMAKHKRPRELHGKHGTPPLCPKSRFVVP